MGTVVDGFMRIVRFQVLIARSVVGGDQRHVIGNRTANETIKSPFAGILDDLGNDHALTSDSADDSDFAGWSATVNLLAEMSVLILAAPRQLAQKYGEIRFYWSAVISNRRSLSASTR